MFGSDRNRRDGGGACLRACVAMFILRTGILSWLGLDIAIAWQVCGVAGVEEQLIDRPVIDDSASQRSKKPAVADRVGVVVADGDLDLRRVERVKRVRQVEDVQSLA